MTGADTTLPRKTRVGYKTIVSFDSVAVVYGIYHDKCLYKSKICSLPVTNHSSGSSIDANIYAKGLNQEFQQEYIEPYGPDVTLLFLCEESGHP